MIFHDQLKRAIQLDSYPPKRIISLVPSQTELLYDLELDEEVIGLTKFCVHPESWFRSKTRIGGTRHLKIELIRKLQPDLIIANKEENEQEQIEELENDFPVWISNVKTLEDAYKMIGEVGRLTNRTKNASELITRIKSNFTNYLSESESPLQQENVSGQTSKLKTCYLIWKDPYMTVGGDTFIHEMMQQCGFENMFADRMRYPQLSIQQLHELNCDIVLLSSEPFPFKQKHIEEIGALLPRTRILLVDGEMFSWYGSRLQYAPAYFRELQHLVFNS